MWTMFRIETVLCTFSVLYVAAKADFKAGNCSEVREACVAKGFSFAHVPLTEISGEHLRVCSRGNTCCTQEMEDSFGPRSKQDFETLVDETSHELRSTFVSRHAKFDGKQTKYLPANGCFSMHFPGAFHYATAARRRSKAFPEDGV
uniref:Glypican-1 n=1 Tax=Gadus morhua TaxID=8049 RepID=A0A8C4ZXY8_GADMO